MIVAGTAVTVCVVLYLHIVLKGNLGESLCYTARCFRCNVLWNKHGLLGSHWSRIGSGETAPSALVNGGSWF